MTTITIQLPDDQAKRLAALAERCQVSPEGLVVAKVRELLNQPDKSFDNAARYVLKKNAELYRRLA